MDPHVPSQTFNVTGKHVHLKSLNGSTNLVFQFAKQKFLLRDNFHLSKTTNDVYGTVSSTAYEMLKT